MNVWHRTIFAGQQSGDLCAGSYSRFFSTNFCAAIAAARLVGDQSGSLAGRSAARNFDTGAHGTAADWRGPTCPRFCYARDVFFTVAALPQI